MLKTLSLDITRPYNLLTYENISKFCKWKGNTTSKTQQSISAYKEDDIYSWTKFPSRLITVNTGKKVTVNRQSYHPMEILKQQLITDSLETLVFREQKPRLLLEK